MMRAAGFLSRRHVGITVTEVAWAARWLCAAVAPKVTAAEIKELRAISGAPMMDCKKALQDPEVAGDLEKAFAWLKERGAVAASKKSGRVAAEGLVSVNVTEDATRAVLVEVRDALPSRFAGCQGHRTQRFVDGIAHAFPVLELALGVQPLAYGPPYSFWFPAAELGD